MRSYLVQETRVFQINEKMILQFNSFLHNNDLSFQSMIVSAVREIRFKTINSV